MCLKNLILPNIVKLIILVSTITVHLLNAGAQTAERFEVSFDTKIRTEFVTNIEVGLTRLSCAARCKREDTCKGVNYETTSKICQICSVGVFTNTVETVPGWQTFKSESLTTTSTTTTTTSTTTSVPPVDCYDVISQDIGSGSGVYSVYIASLGSWKSVYCDMDTDGGGWTVFQRRQNGAVSFNKNADFYKHGFGDPSTEYWLGLSALHAMTSGIPTELQLQFTDFTGESAYEKYDSFSVGAETTYQLSLGYPVFFNDTQGTAGSTNGGSFTTTDVLETCQYIDEVLGFSTEWDQNDYSAQQVRGAPDVYPDYGSEAGNWCPDNDKSANEFLELRLLTAVRILNVSIYETYEPGSLTRIATRTSGDSWQSLWSTTITTKLNYGRIHTPTLTIINEQTRDIRFEMDHSQTWYEIDAIQVCGEVNIMPLETMKYNDGASFSSNDDDSDQSTGNCADIHRGGWWFKDCTSINPNGEYSPMGSPVSTNSGLGGLIVPGWKGYNTMRETKLMFKRKT